MYKAGDPTPFRAQVRHLSLDMELAVLDIVDRSAERQHQRQMQQRRQRSSGRGSGSRLGRAPSQQSSGGAHQGGANVADEADQGEDEAEEEVGEEEEEELDDVQRFWQGVRPLLLGDLPSVQQPVQASDRTGRGWRGTCLAYSSRYRRVAALVGGKGVEGDLLSVQQLCTGK